MICSPTREFLFPAFIRIFAKSIIFSPIFEILIHSSSPSAPFGFGNNHSIFNVFCIYDFFGADNTADSDIEPSNESALFALMV